VNLLPTVHEALRRVASVSAAQAPQQDPPLPIQEAPLTCETENAIDFMSMQIFSPFFKSVSPYVEDASADVEVPVPYAEHAPISFE
jgi:hypothetical protein